MFRFRNNSAVNPRNKKIFNRFLNVSLLNTHRFHETLEEFSNEKQSKENFIFLTVFTSTYLVYDLEILSCGITEFLADILQKRAVFIESLYNASGHVRNLLSDKFMNQLADLDELLEDVKYIERNDLKIQSLIKQFHGNIINQIETWRNKPEIAKHIELVPRFNFLKKNKIIYESFLLPAINSAHTPTEDLYEKVFHHIEKRFYCRVHSTFTKISLNDSNYFYFEIVYDIHKSNPEACKVLMKNAYAPLCSSSMPYQIHTVRTVTLVGNNTYDIKNNLPLINSLKKQLLKTLQLSAHILKSQRFQLKEGNASYVTDISSVSLIERNTTSSSSSNQTPKVKYDTCDLNENIQKFESSTLFESSPFFVPKNKVKKEDDSNLYIEKDIRINDDSSHPLSTSADTVIVRKKHRKTKNNLAYNESKSKTYIATDTELKHLDAPNMEDITEAITPINDAGYTVNDSDFEETGIKIANRKKYFERGEVQSNPTDTSDLKQDRMKRNQNGTIQMPAKVATKVMQPQSQGDFTFSQFRQNISTEMPSSVESKTQTESQIQSEEVEQKVEPQTDPLEELYALMQTNFEPDEQEYDAEIAHIFANDSISDDRDLSDYNKQRLPPESEIARLREKLGTSFEKTRLNECSDLILKLDSKESLMRMPSLFFCSTRSSVALSETIQLLSKMALDLRLLAFSNTKCLLNLFITHSRRFMWLISTHKDGLYELVKQYHIRPILQRILDVQTETGELPINENEMVALADEFLLVDGKAMAKLDEEQENNVGRCGRRQSLLNIQKRKFIRIKSAKHLPEMRVAYHSLLIQGSLIHPTTKKDIFDRESLDKLQIDCKCMIHITKFQNSTELPSKALEKFNSKATKYTKRNEKMTLIEIIYDPLVDTHFSCIDRLQEMYDSAVKKRDKMAFSQFMPIETLALFNIFGALAIRELGWMSDYAGPVARSPIPPDALKINEI